MRYLMRLSLLNSRRLAEFSWSRTSAPFSHALIDLKLQLVDSSGCVGDGADIEALFAVAVTILLAPIWHRSQT